MATYEDSKRRLDRFHEAGKRMARVMLGDTVTALQQLAWGVAFALHARGSLVTANEVALRWNGLFASMDPEAPASFVYTAMLRFLNQRITAIEAAPPATAGWMFHITETAERESAMLGFDFLFVEASLLVRQAEDVTTLSGSRHLIPRASEVTFRIVSQYALAHMQWMGATESELLIEGARYLPYSAALVKKPTTLQCGFSASSARQRWFSAVCDSKEAWTNDKVIDRHKPNFRGWKETLVSCPGANDASYRPDVTRFFERARKSCLKPLAPFAVGENAGPVGSDVVVFDAGGDIVMLDRVWVGYLLHKYSDAKWRYSVPDEPVALWCGEEVVALVAPIVSARKKDRPAPTIAELKRVMCFR